MTASLRTPQGVDLCLDQFNLSAPVLASGEVQCQDADLVIGSAFWESIAPAAQSAFAQEDKRFFQKVFNPFLSDRRDEGDLFTPPPTGQPYTQRLKELLRAEEELRARRRDHFLSNKFAEDDAGPLFPSNWTSTFQGKATSSAPQGGMLQARPDVRAEAAVLSAAVAAAPPAFDRCAEDGVRFRIYRLGSLEVRTIQEHGGEELIGAVFSIRASMQSWGGKWHQTAQDNERVVKVTEYVERALEGPGNRRVYVVLETEVGNAIVTEKLADGMAIWQENPQDLEDRNSLAKVVRIYERRNGTGATVRDIKGLQMKETRMFGRGTAAPEQREQYAQIAFCRASGEVHGFSAGWLRPRQRDHNQWHRPVRPAPRPKEVRAPAPRDPVAILA